MTDLASTAPLPEERPGLIERIGKAIPDPMIIFAWLWVIFFALSVLFAGASYETRGADGVATVQTVKSMATTENVRWIFDNMVLANFMSFGGGVLGIILLVSMAVGVAEHAGLLGALIKRAGAAIPAKFLHISMVFLGIMSSLAVDAGYLILVPLAGLLYASLGKHPLVMTHHGANLLVTLRLDQATIPLLIGFVLLTATVNLLIAGLTSKWLLLGPLFVPMLHAVNPAFTPDVVTAAYRVADSSTNIITPMMIYMGIILAFMRRYVPKFTLGELIIAMFPFSVVFLITWTAFLVIWVALGIPLGF